MLLFLVILFFIAIKDSHKKFFHFIENHTFFYSLRNKALKNMCGSRLKRSFCNKHLQKEKNTIRECRNCCVPDDVAVPEDVLDGDAKKLLYLFE